MFYKVEYIVAYIIIGSCEQYINKLITMINQPVRTFKTSSSQSQKLGVILKRCRWILDTVPDSSKVGYWTTGWNTYLLVFKKLYLLSRYLAFQSPCIRLNITIFISRIRILGVYQVMAGYWISQVWI